MRLRVRFWMLLSLLTLAACGGQQGIEVQGVVYTATQVVEGRQLYATYCAACHGANGEGQFPDAPLAPDATGRIGAPPHNGAGHTPHHSDEWLIRYVREGGMSLSNPETFYPMPAFGDQLSDEQIAKIIAYIKTMWNTT